MASEMSLGDCYQEAPVWPLRDIVEMHDRVLIDVVATQKTNTNLAERLLERCEADQKDWKDLSRRIAEHDDVLKELIDDLDDLRHKVEKALEHMAQLKRNGFIYSNSTHTLNR